jgi:uncharacterized membrane protein YbaN (DUF454 family)
MRPVYFILGIMMVGLAVIGAALPLLPTTPFLLLAVSCFVRSSPRCGDLLFRSPLFGPLLRDWHEQKIIPPTTKIAAIGSMLFFGGTTLVVGDLAWIVNAILLLTMAVGVCVVLKLPTSQRLEFRRNCGTANRPTQ